MPGCGKKIYISNSALSKVWSDFIFLSNIVRLLCKSRFIDCLMPRWYGWWLSVSHSSVLWPVRSASDGQQSCSASDGTTHVSRNTSHELTTAGSVYSLCFMLL